MKKVKVFISQPMNGKTNEEILKARGEAELKVSDMISEECEFIDSFIDNHDKKSADCNPLWYLGKSIEKLSEADVVFFASGWEQTRGCQIEHQCAELYGYKIIDEELNGRGDM